MDRIKLIIQSGILKVKTLAESFVTLTGIKGVKDNGGSINNGILNATIQELYENSQWFTDNATHILLSGQRANLLQTGTYKIGDGVTQLQNLSFLGGPSSQTLAQTLTNGKKTGQQTIESDNGKSILSILNTLSTMVFQDGAIYASAKVADINSALEFFNGSDGGGFYVYASKNEITHNILNEITAPENNITGHVTVTGNTSAFSDSGQVRIIIQDADGEIRASFLGGHNKVLINDVAAYLTSNNGANSASIYADAVNGNHMVNTVKNVLDAPVTEVTSTGSSQDKFKVFGSDLQNKVVLGTDSFNGGQAKFYDSSESETVTIRGESGRIEAFEYNLPTETASRIAVLDSGKTLRSGSISESEIATIANPLSQFAATTSAQLAGVISDETGTGNLVFSSAPTLTNPVVGTQSILDNSTKAASTAYVDIKTPFVTPEMYGAVGNGSTDDQAAMQNAFNSGYPVYLTKGKTYKVNTTITLSVDNCMIVGSGKSSSIVTSNNISILTIQSKNNTIKDVTFEATGGTANNGISLDGNAGFTLYYINNLISGCFFNGLKNAGVFIRNIIGTSSGSNHEGAAIISNCSFSACLVGVSLQTRAEYNIIDNCNIYQCTTGITALGGNNSIIGGQVTDCATGINISSGTNDGHCSCVGTKINHNATNITCTHTRDFVFSACAIYVGNITITGTGKTMFDNCQISMASNTLTITNSPVKFDGCEFDALPGTYTLTGTAPVMSNTYFGTSKLYTPLLSYSEKTTATLDFPSTAAGSSSDLTVSVTGAVDTDAVSLGVGNAAIVSNGTWFAWVSSAGTVTVRFTNNNLVASSDPASGTYTIFLHK